MTKFDSVLRWMKSLSSMLFHLQDCLNDIMKVEAQKDKISCLRLHNKQRAG